MSAQTAGQDDTLHVFLFAHYSDYFIHRGVPMGFQYELLKIMCDSLHKSLDLTVVSDYRSVYTEHLDRKYDVVAMECLTDGFIGNSTVRSLPFAFSCPVLVEKRSAVFEDSVRSVYLPANFSVDVELDSLDTTVRWQLEKSSYLSVEELFDLLENDKIHYLVSDSHSAALLLQFYPDLKISRTLGQKYDKSWILRKDNPALNEEINRWLKDFVESVKYKSLGKKYFSSASAVKNVPVCKRKSRQISPYDNVVKACASSYGVDWRFVVSIMFQESRFSPGLIGFGGSFGLMQMMPATCEQYGITEESSEEEQILAGVKLLSSITKFFKDVEDMDEKLKFVAASYNSGPGHVIDAQQLCRKYGGNPNSWDDVSKYLILKSEREYYADPVVKCGYYPGRHTVNYAAVVMERYLAYKLMCP